MALLKRLIKVRSTNDKILEAYVRLNLDDDDGIYLNVIARDDDTTVTSDVEGTNIIKRSEIYPNENVTGLVLDTNHAEEPNGYIISVCFHTFNNNNSKLYMGRVSINGGNVSWTQCADSPKTYQNSQILGLFSSFLTLNGGTPLKTVVMKVASGDEIIIHERH
ncbi:hypothetical protein [Candidatus Nitrosocosmicus sp. T]